MTIYFDTSALLKLYVTEEYSPVVHQWLAEATTVATSLVSYVEARSALARRRRERTLSGMKEQELVQLLDADWSRYRHVDVTESLVNEAGTLAATHALRTYDAIHLASALELQEKLGRPVTFAAFDQPLNRAAKKVGLRLIK